MKQLALLLFFTLSSITLVAQNDHSPSNEGWLVDLDKAYALHKETGKPIMINFTGSDWCGWCIKLSRDVFTTNEFKKWASENVILLESDFPKRSPRKEAISPRLKSQYDALASEFKITGFPTVWIFNANKTGNGSYELEKIGRTGYNASHKVFTDGVDRMIAQQK